MRVRACLDLIIHGKEKGLREFARKSRTGFGRIRIGDEENARFNRAATSLFEKAYLVRDGKEIREGATANVNHRWSVSVSNQPVE